MDSSEVIDNFVKDSNSIVLDAPSPTNFWEAATEIIVIYDDLLDYDALGNQSDLVVIGVSVDLSKGAVWRFEYDNPDLGEGHSNTTVMRIRVETTIKGPELEEVFVSFATGVVHGEFADVPIGRFTFYLVHVPWLDNPEIEEPLRGVPDGADLYYLIRPEGLLGEDEKGEFTELPLMQTYRPRSPSVYPWDGGVDDQTLPTEPSEIPIPEST